MNLIELHIIQSFPVTCLNRDDLGSPKSAIFGGVKRARISSQCWKRPTREYAKDVNSKVFAGVRSRKLTDLFADCIRANYADKPTEEIVSLVNEIVSVHKKKEGKDLFLFGKLEDDLVDTLFYISPVAVKKVIDYVVRGHKEDNKFVAKFSEISDILNGQVEDAADIALFGRMVASNPDLTVEGAAMFSHALSTHAVSSEIDFFSAVDDRKNGAEDAGAGHIGTTEFNSACYYRYVGINLDLLKESRLFDQTGIKSVLENFIRAVVMANPVARRNAMFGCTLPACILGLRRKGQPLSLANAFEEPVRGSAGLVAESAAKMKSEWDSLKSTFGLDESVRVEVEKGGATLDDLIQKLTDGLA